MHAADIPPAIPSISASMNVGSAPAKEAYEPTDERWSAGRFDRTEAEQAGEDARGHVRRDHRRHGRGATTASIGPRARIQSAPTATPLTD